MRPSVPVVFALCSRRRRPSRHQGLHEFPVGSVEWNAFLLDAARPDPRRICDSFKEASFGAGQERRGRWSTLWERGLPSAKVGEA